MVQAQLGSLPAELQERDDQLATARAEQATARAEQARGIEAYLQHYRERIDGASGAVDAYRAFNTPGNREELGDNFEIQRSTRW